MSLKPHRVLEGTLDSFSWLQCKDWIKTTLYTVMDPNENQLWEISAYGVGSNLLTVTFP